MRSSVAPGTNVRDRRALQSARGFSRHVLEGGRAGNRSRPLFDVLPRLFAESGLTTMAECGADRPRNQGDHPVTTTMRHGHQATEYRHGAVACEPGARSATARPPGEGAMAETVSEAKGLVRNNGGRGGIRTHGGLAPTAVFKTAALNHSATLPVTVQCRSSTDFASRSTPALTPAIPARIWFLASLRPPSEQAPRRGGGVARRPRLSEKSSAAGDRVDMCPVSDTFVPVRGRWDGPLTAARRVPVV